MMQSLLDQMSRFVSRDSLNKLTNAVSVAHEQLARGNGPRLQGCVDSLPTVDVSETIVSVDYVEARSTTTTNVPTELLHDGLLQLSPWRKGPFRLCGVEIDSEWRSNWKWDRLAPHLQLSGRRVLDVGCGNGYYLYRMLASSPEYAVGIDPYPHYYFQFQAIQKYMQQPNIGVLAMGLDEFPVLQDAFDTVFCLGVLYHRRSPLDFLRQLASHLPSGGQLILETLTIEGAQDIALSPKKRYAKMHNCFFLPTFACLANWLVRSGFHSVELLDQSWTTCDEQRPTEWMKFESLASFLDPADPTKTIEGYPAPQRSIVICRKN